MNVTSAGVAKEKVGAMIGGDKKKAGGVKGQKEGGGNILVRLYIEFFHYHIHPVWNSLINTFCLQALAICWAVQSAKLLQTLQEKRQLIRLWTLGRTCWSEPAHFEHELSVSSLDSNWTPQSCSFKTFHGSFSRGCMCNVILKHAMPILMNKKNIISELFLL